MVGEWMWVWTPLLSGVVVTWIWWVQPRLRYRLRDSVLRDATTLSPRQVQNVFATVEDPLLHRLSLEFALFRTYAIPSISKLLDKTGEFSGRCGRRYDDTDLLLREIIENGLETARGHAALERMNEIHANYPSISNDDFLYTLSVFVLEPPRFFEAYGWRQLTDVEKTANFDFWTDVGKNMGIKHIPKSFDEFDAWNRAFEETNMVFAESNTAVADTTVNLMMHGAMFLRPAVVALMDDRLRRAVGYPPAPHWLQGLMKNLLYLRAFVLRVVAPPRLRSIKRTVPNGDDAHALLRPAFNTYARTYSNGYRILDLGPPSLPSKIPQKTKKTVSRGCPVARSF